MRPIITATAEETVEVEELKTDVGMDPTIAGDKNTVPMEASISDPTATARVPG